METCCMNKMIMAIIPKDEGELVLNALIEGGHSATFIETKGGMLRQSQYTLFIATQNKHIDSVCNIIKTRCKVDMEIDEQNSMQQDLLQNTGSLKLGGAVVFIWNLDRIDTY